MGDDSWDQKLLYSTPAAALAVADRINPDPWLVGVMRNERNLNTLVSLESRLADFVANPDETQLVFPPKGRFFRKVCHTVALWYNLDHRLEQVATDPSGELRLVLIKTPLSSVPQTRLAQVVSAASSLSSTAAGTASCANAELSSVPLSDAISSSDSTCVAPKHFPEANPLDIPVPSLHAPHASGVVSAKDTSSCASAKQILGSPVLPTAVGEIVMSGSTPSHEGTGICASSRDVIAHVEDVSSSSETVIRPAVLRRPADTNGRQLWRGSGPAACGKSTAAGTAAVKNVTEEEYETARARIFQKSSSAGDDVESSLRNLALEGSGLNQTSNERYARGPVEGSIGFTRGRGHRLLPSNPSEVNPLRTTDRPLRQHQDNVNNTLARRGDQRAKSETSSLIDADRDDPDFDRRYSKWVGFTTDQPHLSQFLHPSAAYGQQPHLSLGNNSEVMFQYQGQPGFQILPHAYLNTQTTANLPAMHGSSYPVNCQPFQQHVLHPHPFLLPEQSRAVMHQAREGIMSMSQQDTSSSEIVYPAPHALNLFPYSSSVWLPHMSPGNVDWRGVSIASASGQSTEKPKPTVHVPRQSESRHSATPAYGLDSRIDFPSLSEAHSMAKQ